MEYKFTSIQSYLEETYTYTLGGHGEADALEEMRLSKDSWLEFFRELDIFISKEGITGVILVWKLGLSIFNKLQADKELRDYVDCIFASK